MRINKIELLNIGSYEGINEFDIAKQSKNGRIILIGGKNGAGKTTLFTAIKLCLYGYKEAGYQAINVHYKNKIKKLVNDRAKIESNPKAYVMIDFDIMNGQEWDNYIMKRAWILSEGDFETVSVAKNGIVMTEDEKSDFDNYLLNIIPPQLFELYFFDGEEIADFFLNEDNNSKLKEAFLTLCGYDTFDILQKNLVKITKQNSVDGSDLLNVYLAAEEALSDAERNYNLCNRLIKEQDLRIDEIESNLNKSEQQYKASGGLSLKEWKDNFIEIKQEEKSREEKNNWLKNVANEKLPFIILSKELKSLKTQMELEQEMDYQDGIKVALESVLPDVLKRKEIKKVISSESAKQLLEGIQKELDERKVKGEKYLNLSKSEYGQLMTKISEVLNYDKNEIIEAKAEIKASIENVGKIRNKINESSVEGYEEFIKKRDKQLQEKVKLLKERAELIDKRIELEKSVSKCKNEYVKATKEWEKSLKSESITSLTGKTIRYLEKLQAKLYEEEKNKVEKLFMKKINQLMRKEQFIDKIAIGKDFEIHVYKRIVIECKGVCNNIVTLGESQYIKEYGQAHCEDILRASKCDSLSEFVKKYKKSDEVLDVMLEFDKSTMSKGERQVFIMSLYWAMIQLCKKDVPFIIDTPFARIDTEHRKHITKYFFKELKGQVFIFSTNEEITGKHLKLIGDDIQATFLIENVDNKKTIIKDAIYFEE